MGHVCEDGFGAEATPGKQGEGGILGNPWTIESFTDSIDTSGQSHGKN